MLVPVLVGVMVKVLVGVVVAVLVNVFVGVLVRVLVPVFVGVLVKLFVGVTVAVLVEVFVRVLVWVLVSVLVKVFVNVGVLVATTKVAVSKSVPPPAVKIQVGAAPLHLPDQPLNAYPLAGTSSRVTGWLAGIPLITQLELQTVVPPLQRTVTEPLPTIDTLMVEAKDSSKVKTKSTKMNTLPFLEKAILMVCIIR